MSPVYLTFLIFIVVLLVYYMGKAIYYHDLWMSHDRVLKSVKKTVEMTVDNQYKQMAFDSIKEMMKDVK